MAVSLNIIRELARQHLGQESDSSGVRAGALAEIERFLNMAGDRWGGRIEFVSRGSTVLELSLCNFGAKITVTVSGKVSHAELTTPGPNGVRRTKRLSARSDGWGGRAANAADVPAQRRWGAYILDWLTTVNRTVSDTDVVEFELAQARDRYAVKLAAIEQAAVRLRELSADRDALAADIAAMETRLAELKATVQ
jgi:hypothetical protein